MGHAVLRTPQVEYDTRAFGITPNTPLGVGLRVVVGPSMCADCVYSVQDERIILTIAASSMFDSHPAYKIVRLICVLVRVRNSQ